MKRLLATVLGVCVAAGAAGEGGDAAGEKPFAELLASVARTSWNQNNAEKARLFQAERDRLGDRFEDELTAFIAGDLERHYWTSAYLSIDDYLHGRRPRLHLALAIMQQGVALAEARPGLNALMRRYSLHVRLVVLCRRLGLDALASAHKGRAEALRAAEATLAGGWPAMSPAMAKLYESTPLLRPAAPDRPGAKKADVRLQDLIDKAPDGSTLKVPAARYVSAKGVVVEGRRGLKIVCEPGTEVLVEDVNAHVLSFQNCSDVRIEGALLRHVKPRKEYACHGAVVRADGCNGLTIAECELNGCGAVGLSAWRCRNVAVTHCCIRENSFTAFYLDHCETVKITANVIADNRSLLAAHTCDDVEMYDNAIRRNGGYWEKRDPALGPEDR